MTSTFTIECRVHFNNRGRGSRKRPRLIEGPPPNQGAYRVSLVFWPWPYVWTN
jgi:hypothetical protein